MAIVVQGNGGTAAEVGGTTFRALHTHVKPLEYGSLGHYKTAIKLTMATSQNANSRLFEVRNTHASNLLVLTRCYIMVGPGGTVTTGYLGEFDLFRLTGFSAVDTTNTVTPTGSVKRTTGMQAYPGTSAAVRHNTVAGAQAGMTGGNLTKDGNAIGMCIAPLFTLAASSPVVYRDMIDDINGTHPLVCANNEGWELENVVAGSGTANVVHVVVEFAWADVTAF
jgi:hypothetical protein